MATVMSNPISDPQELTARLGRRRPPPRAGVVQIYISRCGDRLVAGVTQPFPIGKWLPGRSWITYEINVSDHLLQFQCKLPCKDDTGYFHAEVNLAWRVSDPIKIFSRNLQDVPGELQPWVCDRMRRIVSDKDPRERYAAETAINDALGEKPVAVGNLGLEICRFKVTLASDEPTSAHVGVVTELIRKKEVDRHEQEINRDRMDFYREALAGGHYGALFLRLAKRPEDIRDIAKMLQQEDAAARNRRLAAFKTMVDSKIIEAFEINGVRVDILKRVCEDAQAGLEGWPTKKDLGEPLSKLAATTPDPDDESNKSEEDEGP
ncbi:MAG: hypothetical protein ACRDJF_12820 [Actinomycetota bacterium]